MKLFLVMLGGKPANRFIEQHDIFVGHANTMKNLIPEIRASWLEAGASLHIDAYREISRVDGYQIEIISKSEGFQEKDFQLFFINLGGYLPGQFDEFHYKMLIVAASLSEAQKIAKNTDFFKKYSFTGANSHIDDKYVLDVDDVYAIEELLGEKFKKDYNILISKATDETADTLHIGYFKLSGF